MATFDCTPTEIEKVQIGQSMPRKAGKPLSDYGDDPQKKKRTETIGIADSTALYALGFEKKFAITEVLMFDVGLLRSRENWE